jgi:histidinol-phosphate aminotransferase
VLERLRELGPEQLATYPEREPVEASVGQVLGVAASELLLTNGVDEAIHLLCQTYLESGDEALIVVPTYSMYRIYAMASGARLVSVSAGKDFQVPVDEVCRCITARTRLIAIANPNNPTGTVTSEEDLLRIARSAPGSAVLVDEAYFEFYGRSILPARGQAPNLFVARTFSKAYGMAGLRIGVLVGDAEQMRAVRRVCSPYNVNAVALACLPEALRDRDYIQQYVAEVRESRDGLERALQASGIQFWGSQANFVLARVGAASVFVEHMRTRGILVRDRSSDPGCEGCVRITLGPRAHSDRLVTALHASFEEIGIAQGASRR